MRQTLTKLTLAAACVVAAAPGVAEAQPWANWSLPSACGTDPVSGTLGVSSVQFTGTYSGVQDASGADCPGPISQTASQGDNYWNRAGNPSGAYAVTPSNLSFIQFITNGQGGTITFAQAVIDPYIALISVGQPGLATTLTFSDVFTVVSSNNSVANLAYWDVAPGSFSIGANGKSLTGNEFSGLLQFKGTFNSLTIATTGEDWHGFTVGVAAVPEPSSIALIVGGFAALGLAAQRRRRA